MLAKIADDEIINADLIHYLKLKKDGSNWCIFIQKKGAGGTAAEGKLVSIKIANFDNEDAATRNFKKIESDLRKANCLINLTP
ncbi:MAG: hypothetical protein OXP71_04790 [Candidatus Poribacteria bacterium]|nr:hypothetical protein [Candidatus Poribacteria bacterium]